MRFGLFTGALRRRSRSYEDLYDEFVDYVVEAEHSGSNRCSWWSTTSPASATSAPP